MRRKPRWYVVSEETAKALSGRGYTVKFENAKWRCLIEGKALWAFTNEKGTA